MAKSKKHGFDDDNYETFTKFKHNNQNRKKKGRDKGRRGEGELWGEIITRNDKILLDSEKIQSGVVVPNTYKASPTHTPTINITPTHEFGPNTHEIKGVKIDMDGVSNIELVENEKDGVKTFGIKFLFKGNKGLYRIIWFNRYQRERDATYAKEYKFWQSLQTK